MNLPEYLSPSEPSFEAYAGDRLPPWLEAGRARPADCWASSRRSSWPGGPGGSARGAEVVRRPLERGPIGQHRQARRAAGFIGPGDGGGVEI